MMTFCSNAPVHSLYGNVTTTISFIHYFCIVNISSECIYIWQDSRLVYPVSMPNARVLQHITGINLTMSSTLQAHIKPNSQHKLKKGPLTYTQ